MTNTVSSLPTTRVEPKLVKLLEGILEGAKRGEIISIAVAGVMNQGQTMEGVYVAETGYPQTLLGTVRIVEEIILRDHIEL